MSNYHHCEACGDPGVERDFRYCGSCSILLEGLEDVTVEPPPRHHEAWGVGRGASILNSTPHAPRASEASAPTSERSERPHDSKRDGRWLVWAANKRGCLRWFQHFGIQRGYPRNLNQWSPAMVAIAIAAKQGDIKSTRS
jgi:hypothetical protein